MERLNRRHADRFTRSGYFPLRTAVLDLPPGTVALFSQSERLKEAVVLLARERGVDVAGDGTLALTRSGHILTPEPVGLNALVCLAESDAEISLTSVRGQRRLTLLLAAGSTGDLEPVAGDPWYDTLLDITGALPVWEMRLPADPSALEDNWAEIAMLLAESAS